MTLHPTFEVDTAHKPESNDEDLKQLESTSVNVPSPPDPNLYRSDVDTSAVDLGKLKRKIDFRLVPWLALLYLMHFLDRTSIGNARVRSVSTWYPPLRLRRSSCMACRRTCESRISSTSWLSPSISSPTLFLRFSRTFPFRPAPDSAY